MTASKLYRRPVAEILERWNAIAERWDLCPDERADLVGGPDRDRGAPLDGYLLLCGEERIRLIVEVEEIYARVIGSDDRVRAWLRRANLNFGGRTPLMVMAATPEWMRWLIDNLGGSR
jgi:hypothetical protein